MLLFMQFYTRIHWKGLVWGFFWFCFPSKELLFKNTCTISIFSLSAYLISTQLWLIFVLFWISYTSAQVSTSNIENNVVWGKGTWRGNNFFCVENKEYFNICYKMFNFFNTYTLAYVFIFRKAQFITLIECFTVTTASINYFEYISYLTGVFSLMILACKLYIAFI